MFKCFMEKNHFFRKCFAGILCVFEQDKGRKYWYIVESFYGQGVADPVEFIQEKRGFDGGRC